jgi:uncharacterized membrane-anchored protein YjiN (DUF445 family)
MQRLALGLLVAAAALYAVAIWLQPRHAAWSWVAAFCEAAMIGAIADWFAVVALFRRPLGLPIPHTAIVPANKSRIGANLADFLCSNFLGTQQVLAKLREFGPADRLADWLADPAHARRIALHLTAAARWGVGTLDDERVRRFVGGATLAVLARIDAAPLAGRLLDVLTANRRHQALLDAVLQQVGRRLDDDAVREQIAQLIAAEVNVLRYVGLDTMAGAYAARKIVAAVGRIVGEMGADPAHPLRERFDAAMAEFVERLKTDPALQARAETLKLEVLAHPQLAAYLQEVWNDVLAWLRDDLARDDDSAIGARIAATAATLGERLRSDAPMRQWIDAQFVDAAPRWIDRYREDIRRYIVERVDAWNTQELSDELERNIGRDLQYVRINGTLVGGLIGLVIHALTQWAGRF